MTEPTETPVELTPQQIKNAVPHELRPTDDRFIFNPCSKRWILKGSPTHIRLVRNGFFANMESTEVLMIPNPKLVKPKTEPKPIKNVLANTLTDIVADKQDQFVDLSKRDTDRLLRKLLFDKLGISPPRKAASRVRKKKKRAVVSSDSSSDSSSSESE